MSDRVTRHALVRPKTVIDWERRRFTGFWKKCVFTQQLVAHTKGMLSWVGWPHGSVHYAYDQYGQPNIEIQKIWDPNSQEENRQDAFRRETQYNAAGEIVEETLPGGLQLVHSYNPRGLLQSTSGSIGDWQESFLTNTDYTAKGLLNSSRHGNDTTTCQKYNDRGQLTDVKTTLWAQDVCQNPLTSSSDTIQLLNYIRTPTGLIQKIHDFSPENQHSVRFDAEYEYDRLYELTKATMGTDTITYAYDSIQNLVQKQSTRLDDTEILGDWNYGENNAGPNQVTTAGQKNFSYDAIGQMKSHNGYDLTFDVAGRLVQATNSEHGTTISVYYDHDGEQRLKITEREGQAPIINRYPFRDYHIRNGQEYWFVGAGAAQAEIKKATPGLGEDESGSRLYAVRYYHKDHLGGTTQVTIVDGLQAAYSHYSPYGLIADSSGEKPVFGYTGAEQIEEQGLGLMRMGTRWIAQGLGRWASADSLFLEDEKKCLESPMECSLYDYVSNNPILYTDPTGTCGKEVHHEAFRERFEGVLPNGAIEAMKAGSDYVDRLAAQVRDEWTTAHHAMRQPGQSQEDAEKAFEFFKTEQAQRARDCFDASKRLAGLGTRGSFELSRKMKMRAYFHAGQVLHFAQDFTSPVHVRDGKSLVWKGFRNIDALKHGDVPILKIFSKETLKQYTPALRDRTIKSMNDTIREHFKGYERYFQ